MSSQGGGGYVATCALTGNTINLYGDEIRVDQQGGVGLRRGVAMSPGGGGGGGNRRRGRTLSAFSRRGSAGAGSASRRFTQNDLSLLCMAVRGRDGNVIAVIEVWNKREAQQSSRPGKKQKSSASSPTRLRRAQSESAAFFKSRRRRQTSFSRSARVGSPRSQFGALSPGRPRSATGLSQRASKRWGSFWSNGGGGGNGRFFIQAKREKTAIATQLGTHTEISFARIHRYAPPPDPR